MSKLIKTVALAAAVAAASTAHAKLERMVEGNIPGPGSSLAFIAIDSIGTPTSIFIDLDFNYADFAPAVVSEDLDSLIPLATPLLAPGTMIQWNFNNNTVSVNGVSRPGSYSWSAEFSQFKDASQTGQRLWGVIAGDVNNFPGYYLSTGRPTAAQLTAQVGSLSANMVQANLLYTQQFGKGTIPPFFGPEVNSPRAGANATVNETGFSSGYVGANENFGTQGFWAGQTSFSAFSPENRSTLFWQLQDANDLEFMIGNMPGVGSAEFFYNDGVLTYAVPVPEPGTYALLLAGLGIVATVAARRRKAAA